MIVYRYPSVLAVAALARSVPRAIPAQGRHAHHGRYYASSVPYARRPAIA